MLSDFSNKVQVKTSSTMDYMGDKEDGRQLWMDYKEDNNHISAMISLPE